MLVQYQGLRERGMGNNQLNQPDTHAKTAAARDRNVFVRGVFSAAPGETSDRLKCRKGHFDILR